VVLSNRGNFLIGKTRKPMIAPASQFRSWCRKKRHQYRVTLSRNQEEENTKGRKEKNRPLTAKRPTRTRRCDLQRKKRGIRADVKNDRRKMKTNLMRTIPHRGTAQPRRNCRVRKKAERKGVHQFGKRGRHDLLKSGMVYLPCVRFSGGIRFFQKRT